MAPWGVSSSAYSESERSSVNKARQDPKNPTVQKGLCRGVCGAQRERDTRGFKSNLFAISASHWGLEAHFGVISAGSGLSVLNGKG